MTGKILLKEQIRAHVLKILSGYCFQERCPDFPKIYILSPWISNVQLEIDRDIYDLDELFFGHDYGIFSINLPYALLLLKLDFGADISLVTLPPVERNYHEGTAFATNLLDFLDEIGCNVYFNPNLHSKLILSNDLALIGSFNLSIAALYEREEIGISIDDMENLRILEGYVDSVIASSSHYSMLDWDRYDPVRSKVTRGRLFNEIVMADSGQVVPDSYQSHEFLNFHFGTITVEDITKEIGSDLEGFYKKAALAYLRSKSHSDEQRLNFLREKFDYHGKHEINEILDFLETKLARKHVPKIPLRVVSVK